MRRLRTAVSRVLGPRDRSVFNFCPSICNIVCFSLSVRSVLAIRIDFTRALLDARAMPGCAGSLRPCALSFIELSV